MAWYGNKRHPATDTPSPDAQGPAVGSNACQPQALTYGASRQAVQLAASMAIAVNTGSPMSHGSRVWAGDPGFGFQGGQRFTGRLDQRASPNSISPTANAITPVQTPTAVRYGMNYGASQGQGSVYPSTGTVADSGTRSLAMMSLGQLGNFGYGG